MAAFTATLVAIDTENPPGRGYRACLDLIAERLDALGFTSVVEPVPGGDADPEHPRFWLRSELGSGPRTVYFHGHVDVVPADDPSQFQPRVTEESIFGRGATDMKSGLVSMIYAMAALRENGTQLGGKVALRIVPDEETGGALGSVALNAKGLLVSAEEEPVCMLTAEPTGGVVWLASRGAITGRVHVKGRTSHVGLQYRGVNAFERMLSVTDALRLLKSEVETRVTSFPLEPEAARHSILMMGGETAGGRNFNVVPDGFSFTVDRRINPEEGFDVEKQRLVEAVAAGGVDATFDIFQEAHAAGVSVDSPVARALGAAIESARGEAAAFEMCPGILENRFYAEKGIPAFAYGPGLLSVAHGPKEFVKRRDIEEVAHVYALAAVEMLGS